MFDQNIKFKYSWRPYQERALNQVDSYLKDGKVNIVAAPGSGKTVLGLELARRLGKPLVILAPTVTIKNQWVDRFVTLFTDFKEVPDWISTDIYNLKFFNVVTYQALHYAYKKQVLKNIADESSDDSEMEKEIVYNSDEVKAYDVIEKLKENNIATFVLDEAHHLKSEWQRSLSAVIEKMSPVNTISLTATPPYDVEYSVWKKYEELCGSIDACISVPELVAADNLCPHQDYIYFNRPSKEEMEKVLEYKEKLKCEIENIKSNSTFLEAIKNHKFIKAPYSYEEELLENVEYYSSMLVFLNYKGEKIPKDNISVLGHDNKVPGFNLEWFEILLKNVIISDRKNYENYEECILDIENSLKAIGVLEKKDLSFSNNKTLEKYFVNSIGKLNSINKIVDIELESLGKNLRMVVLTDYIRKEYLELENADINKLGVIPIFLAIRKAHKDVNMAILTGSMFAIPKSKTENLYGLCMAHNVDTSKLKFSDLAIDKDYSVVSVPESLKNKVMSFISKLFAVGEINIIVGTKSLLGEGWDEPSINTLVLASFVGSYMLSNQMRGRAIRVSSDPRKTANIWHLVCVSDSLGDDGLNIENADYEMLKRRFKAFTGVGYSSAYIRNGIERLEGVQPPFTEEKINSINMSMKENSQKRDEMYDRWKKAIDISGNDAKVNEKIVLEESQKMKKAWFVDNKFIIILVIFAMLLLGLLFLGLKLKVFLWLVEIGLGIYLLVRFSKIKKLSSSEGNIREVAKVLLSSLCRCKFINTGMSRIKVVVSNDKKLGKVSCYLTGCTESENNLFIDSLEEIFSKTINQRYIITRLNKKLEDINDYYNVPTVLSSKKEYAEVFHTYFEARIGKCDLVYTKNAEGRRVLLKARMKGMSIKDKIERKEEYSSFK